MNNKTKVYVIYREFTGGFMLSPYSRKNPFGMLHSKEDAEYFVDQNNGKDDYYYSYYEVSSIDSIDKNSKQYQKFISKRIEETDIKLACVKKNELECSQKYTKEISELNEVLAYYRNLSK